MEELRQHALAVAARILPQRQDAEDVAQETMLRLLQVGQDGTPIVARQALATRIAVRAALDRLRRQRTRAAKAALIAPTAATSAVPAVEPAEVERLYTAIAGLPAKQAAVITLRKLMELDYEDIAGLLGISVESCRSHCRLALQRLRVVLAEGAESGGKAR